MTASRRQLIAGAAALATLPQPFFAQSGLTQPRPVIRVQCQGGPVEATLRDMIIPEFQRTHGIDVTLIVEDDVTILPKLQVARSRAPYDVCTMDNDKAILGAQMGLWAPDQSANLKNIGAIYESCKPPAEANYASQVYEYSLVYNTDTFKVPPLSWTDLWQPGLKVGVPHVSQGYGLIFLYIAAMLNGGSATNLDPGYAAIKRLGNFKVFRSVSQGVALFQQKEIDAAQFYTHRAVSMADAGIPVDKTVPKEGAWGMRTGSQIPKQTGNMKAALLWVDTALSVPYQETFAKALYSPTNADCRFDEAQQKRLILGRDRVNAIREAPWAEILPQRDAILDRWNREFGS